MESNKFYFSIENLFVNRLSVLHDFNAKITAVKQHVLEISFYNNSNSQRGRIKITFKSDALDSISIYRYSVHNKITGLFCSNEEKYFKNTFKLLDFYFSFNELVISCSLSPNKSKCSKQLIKFAEVVSLEILDIDLDKIKEIN